MARTIVARASAFAVVLTALTGQVLVASSANAVTTSKVEFKGGQLRVEGRAAPGVRVVVESTTSAASARADVTGAFKLQATGFTAPDCLVTVTDGQTPTATVRLPACQPSVVPVPAAPATPTGPCLIVGQQPSSIPVGRADVVFFDTTGCDTTTNSGPTPTPVQWKVVAGVLPTGMTGPHSQGTTAGNIIGTPSIAGTYRFTLQVTDQVGNTDQETISVVVV